MKASRAGVKRGISDRERGPNPAATGTVSPLPADIHTSQRRPREELNPGGVGAHLTYEVFMRCSALEDSSPSLAQARTTPASWC